MKYYKLTNIKGLEDTVYNLDEIYPESYQRGKGYSTVEEMYNDHTNNFTLSTEEEYNIQEGIEWKLPEKWGIKRTLETDKVITDFINNYSKRDHCYFSSNTNCPYLHYIKETSSSSKLKEGYTEITFDQFKKYVLKETMEKEIIGYKLKEDCKQYEEAVKKLADKHVLNWWDNNAQNNLNKDKYNFASGDLKNPKHLCSILNNAGVLDLWFEPIYKEEEKILYFGEVKFTIQDNIAKTQYGDVTKEEIKKAIDYIQNPPKLAGYELKLHNIESDNRYNLTNFDNSSKVSLAFGCQDGKFSELLEIYKAFK